MPEDYDMYSGHGHTIQTKNTKTERPQPPKYTEQQFQKEINEMYKDTDPNKEIIDIGNTMIDFLIAKNTKYGNSALEPLRTFSKAPSEEQLLIRMDDKLSRIKNSTEPKMNDIVDLTGYLLLYIVKKEWTSQIKEMID